MTNRIFLSFVILAFTCSSSMAQTKNHADYPMWQIKQEKPEMVFSQTAYIRSAPGVQASIVDSLAQGDTLRVEEFNTNFLTLKNIYAPWAKVSAVKDGKKLTGYLWMGLVALGYAQDAQATHMFGIEKIIDNPAKKEEYMEGRTYVIALHSISAEGVLSTKSWVIPDDGSFSYSEIMLLGNTQLKNVPQVVRIMFSGEACAIPSNYFYAGYTGADFLDLPGKSNVSDAGAFSHVETLLFPNEKGGKPEQIIRITEDNTYEENAKDPNNYKTFTKKSKEVYVWDGVRAKKVK